MIAIIGCNGQLGWELVRLAERASRPTLALDLPDIDITDSRSVTERLSPHRLAVIVNAAAYTAVDKAESEPETAFAVNKDGPANLAAFCRKTGTPLIHVSTDYVFDGKKSGAYHEADPVVPLGAYGRSKSEGENQIRDILSSHIIIRTAWLYGVHGQNFVKTMLKLGKQKETLRVVDDQTGCPTNARDLASAIFAVIDRVGARMDVRWGTYHYCGDGSATWYEFACAIFAVARLHESFILKTIEPIPTEAYPTPASRPKNSVLNCDLIRKEFGVVCPPWRNSLKDCIQEICQTAEPHNR